MKRAIYFLSTIGLLVFTLLSTGVSSRLFHDSVLPETDQAGFQNMAVVNVYELVASGPTAWKLRTPGSGDNPVPTKLVELRKCAPFATELLLARRVCRAVYYSFNIIPSVSERTLVFPFHSFW